MISSGTIGMPLHFGKVPSFLTTRMGQMGDAIVESIVYNYGLSAENLQIFQQHRHYRTSGMTR